MKHETHTLVEAYIDPDLRVQAERILSQLGISPSTAVTFFYQQIILQKGLPFELKLPPAGCHSGYRSIPDLLQSDSFN